MPHSCRTQAHIPGTSHPSPSRPTQSCPMVTRRVTNTTISHQHFRIAKPTGKPGAPAAQKHHRSCHRGPALPTSPQGWGLRTWHSPLGLAGNTGVKARLCEHFTKCPAGPTQPLATKTQGAPLSQLQPLPSPCPLSVWSPTVMWEPSQA